MAINRHIGIGNRNQKGAIDIYQKKTGAVPTQNKPRHRNRVHNIKMRNKLPFTVVYIKSDNIDELIIDNQTILIGAFNA